MPKVLYYIEEAMPRSLREDIRWVFQRKPGRKLFDEAFELHQKPVKFRFSEMDMCNYTDRNGIHTVTLNPHAEAMHYVDIHDQLQPTTIKQIVAHELKHAGQDELVGKSEEEILQAVQAEAAERFGPSPEKEHAARAVMERVKKAGSRRAAEPILREHLESLYSPKAQADALRMLPSYTAFLKRIEAPAMAAESEILALLGKPPRHSDYLKMTEQTASPVEELLRHGLNSLYPQNASVSAFGHQGTLEPHKIMRT